MRTVLLMLLAAVLAFDSGRSAINDTDSCRPIPRSWESLEQGERPILAQATSEWSEYRLEELPFLGPYQPARVDTIEVPAPGPDEEPGVTYWRRPATPERYLAQRFAVLDGGSGLGVSEVLWVIPMTNDPSCTLWPHLEADWIPAGDTAVFVLTAEDIGETPAGSSITKQWMALGPYTRAYQSPRSPRSPLEVFERLSSPGNEG